MRFKMFMGNAKSILSPYSFALCFYCSLRRTHTARYLLLLNQVRDPLTHIYMHECVYNKYMKFRRGNSFCFISKRYTCLCICICKCICSLCLQQCVCMSDCMSFGRCARHQKSKMAAQFANTKC